MSLFPSLYHKWSRLRWTGGGNQNKDQGSQSIRGGKMDPNKPKHWSLSVETHCKRDGAVVDFQWAGMTCLAAEIKFCRKFCFCNVTEPCKLGKQGNFKGRRKGLIIDPVVYRKHSSSKGLYPRTIPPNVKVSTLDMATSTTCQLLREKTIERDRISVPSHEYFKILLMCIAEDRGFMSE